MVEISLSGSGEGPGWATAPGYSTAGFPAPPISTFLTTRVPPGLSRTAIVSYVKGDDTSVRAALERLVKAGRLIDGGHGKRITLAPQSH